MYKKATTGFDTKKIRIDPSDAPKVVSRIMDNIISGIKSEKVECIIPEPGMDTFERIAGKFDGHSFEVKYIARSYRDKCPSLYISYDNYEFTSGLNEMDTSNFFNKLDGFIKKNYMFDLNSRTYVPRPKEIGFFEDVFSWFRSKFNTKVK